MFLLILILCWKYLVPPCVHVFTRRVRFDASFLAVENMQVFMMSCYFLVRGSSTIVRFRFWNYSPGIFLKFVDLIAHSTIDHLKLLTSSKIYSSRNIMEKCLHKNRTQSNFYLRLFLCCFISTLGRILGYFFPIRFIIAHWGGNLRLRNTVMGKILYTPRTVQGGHWS